MSKLKTAKRRPKLQKQQASEKIMVSPKEAAELLSISPRKLWTLTNQGHIPIIRLGGLVRYSVESLRVYVESLQK